LDQTRQQLSGKETELNYQTRYTQQLSAELDQTKRRLSDKRKELDRTKQQLSDKFTLELEQARQQSTDENIKFKAELEASLRQQLTDKQKIELEQAKAELFTRYKQRLAEKEAELKQHFADKFEQAKAELVTRYKQRLAEKEAELEKRDNDDEKLFTQTKAELDQTRQQLSVKEKELVKETELDQAKTAIICQRNRVRSSQTAIISELNSKYQSLVRNPINRMSYLKY
jgi:hypothetical protein